MDTTSKIANEFSKSQFANFGKLLLIMGKDLTDVDRNTEIKFPEMIFNGAERL